MKEIKGILQAIDCLVKQSEKIIEEKETRLDRMFSYPIHYAPTDMLKKYVKKYDSADPFSYGYDHEGVALCERELEQREAYGIIVSKKESKQ